MGDEGGEGIREEKGEVGVKRGEGELHWRRTTTHTVMRRLWEKGLFENDGGTVYMRLSREEFYAKQSKKFVEDTFSGSLPAFLAAFTSGRGLTAEEAGELRAMIDQAEERV